MSSVGFLAAPACTSRARISPYTLALSAVLVFGVALRAAGAGGNLWFDEIWSLQNLEGLSHPGEIFWDISQDNNHYLNSLWLWIVGPRSSPVLQRAASIAFGAGSIVFAARIARREGGDAGGLIAAAAFATSGILVQYGSEARGYSGMVFGLLWAIDAALRHLDDPAAERPRFIFACAVAIGSLSHVAMLGASAALLAGVSLGRSWNGRSARSGLVTAMRLGSALVLGAIPACLAIAAGILHTHSIRFGDQTPFTWERWSHGLGGAVEATLGLPGTWGSALVLSLAVPMAVTALLCLPERLFFLFGTLIVALPLGEALAHVPNLHIPRFHLPSVVVLLLALAMAAARLTALHRRTRAVTVGVLIGFLIGSAVNLAPFLHFGRGHYAAATQLMGDGTYATNEAVIAARTVRFQTALSGRDLRLYPMAECASRKPDWFVLVEDNGSPQGSDSEKLAQASDACRARFEVVARFPYAGLSGFRWTLYKRGP